MEDPSAFRLIPDRPAFSLPVLLLLFVAHVLAIAVPVVAFFLTFWSGS